MKVHRPVKRRSRPLELKHLDLPLNPTMEQGLIVKLQETHFQTYIRALQDFVLQIAPYYRIDLPAQTEDESAIDTDSAEYFWISEVFQTLVIIGASLSDEQINEIRLYHEKLVKGNTYTMPGYDGNEAILILNKIFYQVMYETGFIDEINFRIRIPSFRYRMKIGLNLSYAPSFPLHAFTLQLCGESGIKNENSFRLLENFAIFYWNLFHVDQALKPGLTGRYRKKLEQILKKSEPDLPSKEILDFIQLTMDDLLFNPGLR
ncbi:MAG: hypothetical protein LCH54_01500 [Bacteroidetes bacterium]|nr:hypothetical protein [Bacteroidota bacterium]